MKHIQKKFWIIIAAVAMVALAVGLFLAIGAIKRNMALDPVFIGRGNSLYLKKNINAKKEYLIKDNMLCGYGRSYWESEAFYDDNSHVLFFYDKTEIYAGGPMRGTLYAVDIRKLFNNNRKEIELVGEDVSRGIETDTREPLQEQSVYAGSHAIFYCMSTKTLYFTKYEDGCSTLYSYKMGRGTEPLCEADYFMVSKDGQKILIQNESEIAILKLPSNSKNGIVYDKLSDFGYYAFANEDLSIIHFVERSKENNQVKRYNNGIIETIHTIESVDRVFINRKSYLYKIDEVWYKYDLNDYTETQQAGYYEYYFDADEKSILCGEGYVYVKTGTELYRCEVDKYKVISKTKICDVTEEANLLKKDGRCFLVEKHGELYDEYELVGEERIELIKDVCNRGVYNLEKDMYLYRKVDLEKYTLFLKNGNAIFELKQGGLRSAYFYYNGNNKLYIYQNEDVYEVNCNTGRKKLVISKPDVFFYPINRANSYSDSAF